MKSVLSVVLSVVLFAVSANAVELQPGKAEMLRELDFIHQVFATQYAPADWKKSYANWDIKTEIDRAKNAVSSAQSISVRDYQAILASLFQSTRDYHVSVSFYSTEMATLPFTVKGVGGRYFLSYIDRSKLNSTAFPFAVGDELVRFGNQTAAEAVAALLPKVGNTVETDQALAELTLTRRRASRGMEVPKGPIEVAIVPHGATEPTTRQLIWDYTEEKIGNPFEKLPGGLTASMDSFEKSKVKLPKIFHPQMISTDAASDTDSTDTNPYMIGMRTSYVPALGAKIWESGEKDPFYAYIFRAPDRRIVGYIRIPSYVPSDLGLDGDGALVAFRKVIDLFESTTDGMVIDEVNNPGGSVFYLYALASMLSDKTLTTPRHRMAITGSDAMEAATTLDQLRSVTNDDQAKKLIGETMEGYPVTYELVQFTREFSQFILSEYRAGHRLTAPYWIGGVDHINPDPTHYTKPILVLTNALDFSGGDFFPAILQDNKRVTILGTRTAGAGGYIAPVTYPSAFGVSQFVVTGSIAERADLNPIENLGVKPDIEYSLTERDIRENGADYKAAILDAVGKLVK